MAYSAWSRWRKLIKLLLVDMSSPQAEGNNDHQRLVFRAEMSGRLPNGSGQEGMEPDPRRSHGMFLQRVDGWRANPIQSLDMTNLAYINLPRLNLGPLAPASHDLRSIKKHVSHWNSEQRTLIVPINNRKGWAFTKHLANPLIAKYFLNLRQGRDKDDPAGDLDKNRISDVDEYIAAPVEEPEKRKRGRRAGKGRRAKGGKK